MKLTLRSVKPRNPFVVHSLRRRAGSHAKGIAAQRQQAARALQREMGSAHDPSFRKA